MNKRVARRSLKSWWLRGGIWRVVCSYNCREADGRDWGVIRAIPKSASPLQAIEKKQLKIVLNLRLARPFVDRH
jgi:hypothetical protein